MNTDVDTQELDPMEALVRKADADRDRALEDKRMAIAERDFARKQGTELAKQLKTEREIYEKEIRRANRRIIQNIRFPFVMLMAFAGLALIIGLMAKSGMISTLLGEPLIFGCVFVCSFFGGIVWARTEWRHKNNKH